MNAISTKPPKKSRAIRKVASIDRDKLRAALRKLGDDSVFYMLGEAIDLLPPATLAKLVARYLDVKQLRPDAVGKKNLISIACRVSTASPFGALLGLLRYIDECNDDIVFFADEAGSWQVGVDWAKVLPALFQCLSRTTEPNEYGHRVVETQQARRRRVYDRHVEHRSGRRRRTVPDVRKQAGSDCDRIFRERLYPAPIPRMRTPIVGCFVHANAAHPGLDRRPTFESRSLLINSEEDS